MHTTIVSILLAAWASNAAGAPGSPPPAGFRSSKSLPVLEQCLVGELSDLGDPTFMRTPGSTTLMIRNGEGAPILVEITPPSVTITTRASLEIRERVRRCL